MSATPRLTEQTIRVLRVLLADPAIPRYGLDIAREAQLKTGTVHPILDRLQRAGWIASFWESDEDQADTGRPRRRFYRFTAGGAELARNAIAEATQASGSPAVGRLRPQPGH
jgi:PadR family transcriptional regulator, regulatory protein PadR